MSGVLRRAKTTWCGGPRETCELLEGSRVMRSIPDAGGTRRQGANVQRSEQRTKNKLQSTTAAQTKPALRITYYAASLNKTGTTSLLITHYVLHRLGARFLDIVDPRFPTPFFYPVR